MQATTAEDRVDAVLKSSRPIKGEHFSVGPIAKDRLEVGTFVSSVGFLDVLYEGTASKKPDAVGIFAAAADS